MSQMMQRLLYPYMAPTEGEGDDLPGDEAALAKARGDDLEDLEEAETEEGAAERDEKGRFKAKEEKSAEEEPVEEEAQEEEVEEEAPTQKGKKAPPSTIPKARFDELSRKSRERIAALEQQVTEMSKGAQQVAEQQDARKVETQISALDKEYEDLLADGKNREAAAKMREIRALERDLMEAKVEQRSSQSTALAVEQVRFDALVDQLEEKYPQLKVGSDEYSEEMVEEIQLMRQGYERVGMSSSQALAKAAKYVLQNQVAATEEAEREPAPKKGLRDSKVGEDRKKKAIDRNEKDAKAVPPRVTEGGGKDSDKLGGGEATNVAEMTEEEFDALPETTKARLRGDFA
jgi:hypothetical protein